MRRLSIIAVIAFATQHARADAPPDELAPTPAVPPAAPTSATPQPAVEPRATLPAPNAAPSDRAGTASYRIQTLAADGLAAAFFTVAMAGQQEPLLIFCIPTYLLIPPTLHLSKQRPGRALASLSMRVGLPLLGVLIGDSIPRDCGPHNDCANSPRPAPLVGLFGGFAAAIALDAIFLAAGDAPKRKAPAAWTPIAGPTQSGFALGVAGQF